MKAINKEMWQNAADYSDYIRLPAGGYVCAIVAVQDVKDKEYLEITFDIAEGNYADYYSDDWGKEHAWAHRFFRSYKDSAMGMMKGFLKAVDESNGTSFSHVIMTGLDEHNLVGRLVGLILREEEYMSNRGEIRTRLAVYRVVPVETIRSGKYRVPETKPLQVKKDPPTGFFNTSDYDMPF